MRQYVWWFVRSVRHARQRLRCSAAGATIELNCQEHAPYRKITFSGTGHPHPTHLHIEYGANRFYNHDADRVTTSGHITDYITHHYYDRKTYEDVIDTWRAGEHVYWECSDDPRNAIQAIHVPEFPELLTQHRQRCYAIVPLDPPPFRL